MSAASRGIEQPDSLEARFLELLRRQSAELGHLRAENTSLRAAAAAAAREAAAVALEGNSPAAGLAAGGGPLPLLTPQGAAEAAPPGDVVLVQEEATAEGPPALSWAGESAEEANHPAATRFGSIVGGPFDAFTDVCILINSMLLLASLHLRGERSGAILHGEISAEEPEGKAVGLFFWSEYIFSSFFLLEMSIRLLRLRSRYFVGERGVSLLNIFDLLVVSITSVDTFILTPILGKQLFGNVSLLRIIRMCRVLRVYRLFRTLAIFESLRLLFATIVASFWALFWSMCVFWVVMFIGALTMCQLLSSACLDDAISIDTRLWVFKMYGTPTRALYTFFEMTFSGCWPNYARVLVEDVSPGFALFFVFYIGGVSFAMMRIVAALFLKETMRVAERSDRDAVLHTVEQVFQTTRHLATVLQAQLGDDDVAYPEMMAALRQPLAAELLRRIDLAKHEILFLFHMLDDSDGQMDRRISAEGFVNAAFMLKGLRCKHDLINVMQRSGKILRIVQQLEQRAPLPLAGHGHCAEGRASHTYSMRPGAGEPPLTVVEISV